MEDLSTDRGDGHDLVRSDQLASGHVTRAGSRKRVLPMRELKSCDDLFPGREISTPMNLS